MKEQEDPVYVGLDNPVEIRRALLESSKSLIKILQENESRKHKREQKHKLIMELKETIKELTGLLSELKSQLPKVKISSLPKKPKPVAPVAFTKVKNTTPVKLPPRPVHLTEAQKLEKELKDIEDKLGRLG